jgi:uridine kinase
VNPPELIAIAGGSGSGKSHLAHALCRNLPDTAVMISLDDFYRDLRHLTPENRETINFDEPEAIDWDAVESTIAALMSGHPADIPQYDFVSHTRLPEGRRLEPGAHLILEGLWPLARPALYHLARLKIYIDCPESLRLQRRISRDSQGRGRSGHSVTRQFLHHVQPMHQRHVEPQKALADLVISSPFGEREIARILKQLAIPAS